MKSTYKVPNEQKNDLVVVTHEQWLQWMVANKSPYYLADDKITTDKEEICIRTIYTMTCMGMMEENGTWFETWVHHGKPNENHEASFRSTAKDSFTEHRTWSEAIAFHKEQVERFSK